MSRRLGLRPALIALVVGAACIPAVALAAWLAWQAGRAAMAQTEALVGEKAAIAALAAGGRLAAPMQHLLWLAAAPSLRQAIAEPLGPGFHRAALESAFAAFLQRQAPQVASVALYDERGALVAFAAHAEAPPEPDAYAAAWYGGAVSELGISGGFAPVHIARHPGQPSRLIYACALLRPDNAVAGVLMLTADVPALLADICGPGRTLHDAAGVILAGQTIAGPAVARSAPVRVTGQPAVHWRCTVAVPRAEALAPVREGLYAVLAAALIAVAIAAPAAWLLARRLLRPLQRLEQAVHALRAQGVGTPLPPVGGPPEIAAIADAIEELRRSLHEHAERLEETSERLRVVADLGADWELWLAPDGRVLHSSPACQELSGLPPERFLADPDLLWRLVDPQDLPQLRADLAASRAGEASVGQWRLHRPDGAVRWVEHMIRRVRAADGADRGWRLTLRDITARRAFEERLRHEQRVQLLGRLAGGIAHDVNNLLTVIRSHAELMQRHPDQLDRLASIVSAVERGAALTRQLLALSRRQVGGQSPTDLARVARETVDMLRRTWGRGVEIVLRMPDEGLWARINRAEFGQAVMNLLVNARDAMPEGGTITIEGRRVEHDGQAWCEIAVADQGVGMDAATIERIFEPYFTTKGHGKGTGLGLPIVQAVIEQAGGTVAVQSELGRGSTFTLRLPACHPEPQTPEDPLSLQAEVLRGLSVLVADDNRVQAERLADLLEGAGALVRVARDGVEALAIAERLEGLDLLIVDILMPGLNGIEAAQRIRRRHPRVALLFITGYADADRASWALPGGSDMLIKPFDERALIGAVLALLRRRGDG